MAKKLMFVRVCGTGIDQSFQVLSHEIVGQPADTFHKFVMPDGAIVYWNNFGIRTITIADSPDGLK